MESIKVAKAAKKKKEDEIKWGPDLKLDSGNKVSRLKSQVERQQNKIAWGDDRKEPKKSGGPSVVSRVFDVLSRPNFAVAEGIRRSQETQRKGKGGLFGIGALDEFAGGLGAGISGKKKTTFSKVLEEGGVKNKAVRGAAGLVLDIAADPTTYLSFGASAAGKVGKIEKGVTGAKAFTRAIGSESAKKVANEAVVNEIRKSGQLAQALSKTEKAAKYGNLKKVAEKARVNYALNVAKEAEATALSSAARRAEVRVMGRPIVSSEKVYRGLAKVGEPIGRSNTGQLVSKAFRTASMFPGRTNQLKRMFENQGVAAWEDASKMVREEFSVLSKADRREIAHAIEEGRSLDGILSDAGQDLGIFQKKAKAVLDDLYDEENLELGVLPDGSKLDNYVYHFYRKKGSDYKKLKAARKAVASEKFGPAQQRTIPTLNDAKVAGLSPVEEIDDILSLRLAKNHQIKARKSFVKAVEEEYGVKLDSAKDASKFGLVKGESDFLSGQTYFPPEIKKTLDTIERISTDDEVANELLRKFDKIQTIWKFGATAINPGHHVRNLIGDIFLNYEDGVVNPNRYREALRAIKKQGNFKVNDNFKVSGEEVYREFVASGGKSGFYANELDDKLAGKIVRKVRGFSEQREDFGRMAHFIDALKKEGKGVKNHQQLREAAIRAGARVNKFNIDYGDLTPFERKYMRRAIPFYTWVRKNIPLQIEALALRPSRIAAVPKGIRAIQELLGTNETDPTIGEVIPKWIRELAAVRLVGEGEGRNAIYWAPGLPIQDIGRFTEGGQSGVARSILSSITPFARIPIEQATGESLFSEAPVKGNLQYASEQVPFARVAMAATNPDKRNTTKLLNYLLGLGLYEVTPEAQLGELRRQQDPLQQQLRKQKEKARKKVGF